MDSFYGQFMKTFRKHTSQVEMVGGAGGSPYKPETSPHVRQHIPHRSVLRIRVVVLFVCKFLCQWPSTKDIQCGVSWSQSSQIPMYLMWKNVIASRCFVTPPLRHDWMFPASHVLSCSTRPEEIAQRMILGFFPFPLSVWSIFSIEMILYCGIFHCSTFAFRFVKFPEHANGIIFAYQYQLQCIYCVSTLYLHCTFASFVLDILLLCTGIFNFLVSFGGE